MTTAQAGQIGRFTTAGFGSYALLGWALSGMGAALPQIRHDVGGRAGLYPAFTGAALVVLGLVDLRRRSAEQRSPAGRIAFHTLVAGAATVAVAATRWPTISLLGAAVLGVAGALLIRLIPAALHAWHPADFATVITRGNAWSSLASITGPVAIGASTAIGWGWQAGFVALPVIVAFVVPSRLREATPTGSTAAVADRETSPVPPGTRWFDAWLVLCLSIVVEFAFVYFAATYLEDELGLSPARAAAGAAAFAVGMTAARFLASSTPSLARVALPGHLSVIGAGFALMWLADSPAAVIVGLGLAGFGAAMLYPIGIDRLVARFGPAADVGAARGALASGTALLAAPAMLEVLRTATDVRTAFLAVPVLLLAIAAVARRSSRVSPLALEHQPA